MSAESRSCQNFETLFLIKSHETLMLRCCCCNLKPYTEFHFKERFSPLANQSLLEENEVTDIINLIT